MTYVLTFFTWRMRLTNQIFELRLINSVFNTITLTNKSWIYIALLLLQLVTSNIFFPDVNDELYLFSFQLFGMLVCIDSIYDGY